MSETDVSGGPLDVATLTVLAQRASTHPLVDDWTLQPDALSPRYLELRLDVDQYPAPVEAARLDIRWYEGGDYSVHYLESREGGRWQCRWDRHPKPDAPVAHFHPPPDGASDVAESGIDADHHLDVLFAVLDWVDGRVASIHDA